MSIERRIVERINESRRINESQFKALGSTFKCVFGRYYRDGEEITRDYYFKVKELMERPSSRKEKAPVTKSYDRYTEEDFDSVFDDIEEDIEFIANQLKSTKYDYREDYEDKLDKLDSKLSDMQDYMNDEQYERAEELRSAIDNARDTEYEEDDGSDEYYDEY